MQPDLPTNLPSYDDIVRASERLAHAHRTPVLTSATADAIAGASLFFKCENFQRMGAFKFRGGYNAIARLTPAQRAAGVVTFSSGNHAQAIALASRMQGVQATIIMPLDAPAAKRRHRGLRRQDRDLRPLHRGPRNRPPHQAETGATLIPPYDHEDVIAGQGTAARTVRGSGRAGLPVRLPGRRRVAERIGAGRLCAEPALPGLRRGAEAGNDGQQSLRKGEVVRIPAPKTLADGAATTTWAT